jgi:hypothetical protein
MILKDFILSGYPRSGNTFLKNALEELYPEYNTKSSIHSVSYLKNMAKNNKVLVPFRNPEDCIPSWTYYRTYDLVEFNIKKENTYIDDINFFIRFYKESLQNAKNLIFLDFDKFSTDLNYLTNIINNSFNIEHEHISLECIKTKMSDNNLKKYLPRSNTIILDEIKKSVYKEKEFILAKKIYQNLKEN